MITNRLSALKRNTPLLAASALFVMSMSNAAHAENPATKVGSGANGLIVNLGVLTPAVGITIASEGPTSGSATVASPTYSGSHTIASVNQTAALGNTTNLTVLGVPVPLSVPLTQGVKTGIITTSASGTFPTSTATATVNDLGVDANLSTALGTLLLLGIDAKTISSTTSFTGGVLGTLHGSSTITNLSLSTLIPGLNVSVNAAANPAANTTILDLGSLVGLKIIANEQILTDVVTGNTHTATLTTNALDINFTNFLLGGKILNGQIIVAQSSASFTRAVPEMSTWAMMIIGLGGLGGSLRSRNRAKTRVKFSTGLPALQAA